MNFTKIFLFVFACFVLMSTVSGAPEPRWKFFKKVTEYIVSYRRPHHRLPPGQIVVKRRLIKYKKKPFMRFGTLFLLCLVNTVSVNLARGAK
ncbi:unnamed protein product [Spodoptera littoralis]|uniref:Uncharacterized protein n=1 Tax=Spodoptera littoralis TaxID=7109 RepID=A0A9P0N1Y4_SPOLI|nr:unnamed protein product [Spodoptera littoralis]CAH1641637.1 unnamed protein product [Spodoptera littoralis]